MKKVVVFLALTLVGCASKHYEVCVAVQGGAACMHDGLSKPDALSVGAAFSALGYDVNVRPKTKSAAVVKAPGPPPKAPEVNHDNDADLVGATKI